MLDIQLLTQFEESSADQITNMKHFCTQQTLMKFEIKLKQLGVYETT